MKRPRPIPCPDPSPAALTREEAKDMSTAFKVLAEPARLRLLSLIAAQPEGACGSDLCDPLGLTQPTVSHHLKVLHQAGLVSRDRDGVWVCYRVLPEGLRTLADALSGLASRREPATR